MKRLKAIAIVWITVWLVLFGGNADAERGIRVKKIDDLSHGSGKVGAYKALIIGINDYEGPEIPDLKTAINDAKAMARVLKKKYGFKVTLLLDREATREAIYKGLRSLAVSAKPNDSVLIYFAGHGDLDRTFDGGWWIPADAMGGNPATYLDNVQVQKVTRSTKARHVLLISDSCYSGTLFGEARSMPPVTDDKYYLSLYNEKSRWGLTSGNKTPVSDKGSGGHSVFAYQLIKELERSDKPFISIQEIYTRIAPVIANNSEQTPRCSPILNAGDQGGQFVFMASVKKEEVITKEPPPTIPKVQKNGIDKEMLFWQSIQDSDDPALFEEYLKAFRNGIFVPIAKSKIKALKQKKVVASIPPEVTKSRLFVEVKPENARVRILNIRPKFHQGMELDPGRYHVEASDDGYETKKMWVKLEAGKDETFRVSLEQKAAPPRSTPTKYLEAEKQQTQMASLPLKPKYSPPVSASEEIERDGIYIAYANGIVRDTSTGLEWIAGQDKDTNWHEAKSWVESLNIDGGGWRMPTADELAGLFKKGAGTRNMTPLLKTTGHWVWSGQTKDSSSALLFAFDTGGGMYWPYIYSSSFSRAFAVRSRSKGYKVASIPSKPKYSSTPGKSRVLTESQLRILEDEREKSIRHWQEYNKKKGIKIALPELASTPCLFYLEREKGVLALRPELSTQEAKNIYKDFVKKKLGINHVNFVLLPFREVPDAIRSGVINGVITTIVPHIKKLKEDFPEGKIFDLGN